MSEPAQKCEKNANSKQNYSLKLFIAVKRPILDVLPYAKNIDFLGFVQKMFYNIGYRIGKGYRKQPF